MSKSLAKPTSFNLTFSQDQIKKASQEKQGQGLISKVLVIKQDVAAAALTSEQDATATLNVKNP